MRDTVMVRTMEWDPEDAGMITVAVYFKRFWWPVLGSVAGSLYELLLAYRAYGWEPENIPVQTLATTLGVARDELTGHTTTDDNNTTAHHLGAIKDLQTADLIRAEHLPNEMDGGLLHLFDVRHRPQLLTDTQLALLPAAIRADEAEWRRRHVPKWVTEPGRIRSDW